MPSPHSEAERIYADALSELGEGESLDIEELCQEHTEHTEELHELHLVWSKVQGVVDRLGLSASLSERIKAKYGNDADPGVTLDKETTDAFSTEVLERLGQRHGAFGRYKIQGEVARGGQGAVLRIWDEDLRRNLAMKVILGQSDGEAKGDTPKVDSRTLGRFLEEAQVTGQLDHPGIVPVHELGLDSEGRIYFTMKLVKGRTLREIFDLVHAGEEGWTVTRALGVMLKVCEAMSYAHSKGVIHRDLKPGNIMVGRFGEVYVMDWGLARVLGEEDHKDIRIQPELTTASFQSERRDRAEETPDSPLMTMDGDVVGTPAYMSPEQARGDLDQLGPQSDVYAVGAMLYQLLTGQMPYVPRDCRVSNYAIWRSVQDGPPRPLRTLTSDVVPELEAISEKAMARDAAQRYGDMEELGSDLRAYQEHRVVRAYRTGATIELAKWVQRNRGVAASLVALLALVVIGLSGLAVVQNRANASLLRANYVANISAAEASLLVGEAGEARRQLGACDLDLRRWEWRHLKLRVNSEIRKIPVVCTDMALSPDGSRIACAGFGSDLRVFDLQSSQEIASLDGHDRWVRGLVFLDEDRLVSGDSGGAVRVWSLQAKTQLLDLKGHDDRVTAIDASSDRTRIVSSGVDGTVRVWDAASGEPLRVIAANGGAVHDLHFSGEGDQVVACTSRTIRWWDISTGEKLRELISPVSGMKCIAISADGDLVAAGTDGSTIEDDNLAIVWDADTGEIKYTFPGHVDGVSSVQFSSDARWLVSAGSRGAVRIWDMEDGELERVLYGRGGFIGGALLTRDDQFVVSSNGDSVRVWDFWQDQAIRQADNADRIEAISVLPRDGSLAVVGAGGALSLWDMETLERTAVLGEDRHSGNCLGISGDGLRAVTGGVDRRVRLWDLTTGEQLAILGKHERRGDHPLEGMVLSVAFNVDCTKVVSVALGGSVCVWDIASGTLVFSIDAREIEKSWFSRATYDPSGRYLLLATESRLRVLDASSCGPITILDGHEGGITGFAFHPHEAVLATSSDDGTIRLWDLEDLRPIATLSGHVHQVNCVAFSPDGTRIASGSWDRSVRVWDYETRESLISLRAHIRPVAGVAFSVDGKKVLSGAGNLIAWESERPSDGQLTRRRHAAKVKRLVDPAIEALFDELVFPEDVVRELGKLGFDDEVRAEAVRRARMRGEPSSSSLNSRAWFLVDPDRVDQESNVALGLRLARAGVERAPGNAAFLDTLAWALFANGLYDEALPESARAHDLVTENDRGKYQGYLDRLRAMIEAARAAER
jgi:eukaryotic-like serine/threonine-protein kinase